MSSNMIDLAACRAYLQSPSPTLTEYAAWITLNEEAAAGSISVVTVLIELIDTATDDAELALLAAGPVRELLEAESNRYEELLIAAQMAGSNVHHVLCALRRYANKIVLAHRVLRRFASLERDGPTDVDELLVRLDVVSPWPARELPPLPRGDRSQSSQRDEMSASSQFKSEGTDLDTLISANPVAAWYRLSAALEAAPSADVIQSQSWYLALLLHTAEELVATHVLECLHRPPFAHALDAAGVDGCSEQFIDSVITSL